MNKETIVIDSIRYYADRPRSCLAGTFRFDAARWKEIDNNNAFRVFRMRKRFFFR